MGALFGWKVAWNGLASGAGKASFLGAADTDFVDGWFEI